MKLEEQLQDRTVYLGLGRNWDPSPNQGRSQWFAKKTEDPFFILIPPGKFLSYAGFYTGTSLDHAANAFQGMTSKIQLAHFKSPVHGFSSTWCTRAGRLNCLRSSLVFWISATLPLWPRYWLTVTSSLQLIYCMHWLLPGGIKKSAYIPE